MMEEMLQIIAALKSEPWSQENECTILHLQQAIQWQEYKRMLPPKRYEKPPEEYRIVVNTEGIPVMSRLR